MADKNDDDSDHSDISESDHKSLQSYSSNSSFTQKSSEFTFTSSNEDLTISYTSSLQSDVSVQTGTSTQDLDLKLRGENNDNSETNYKSSELSGHPSFGNLEKTSKSISDSKGLEVDEKDHPQSIEDTFDSNITTDSEKARQIPVKTFKDDSPQTQMRILVAKSGRLQSHDGKGPQDRNRNTSARNDSEVTILFNPIRQDDLVICKEESMENIFEIMKYMCQIFPDTSQVSTSSSERIGKSIDDTLEYKVVKLKTRGFLSQVSTLLSADHNSDDDLNMANLSLILSSIYLAAGDSHYEEEVGIGENDTHQNNNVSTDGSRNRGLQSGVNKTSIYDFKQPWFVIDLQSDNGQINQSDHDWQAPCGFLPDYTGLVNFHNILEKIEKNHSYKLIHTFSGFHKKGCDEDMKNIAGLIKGDWTWINPSLKPIIVGMAGLHTEKSLSMAGQDGGGNGEEASGDDEEGSHQDTNANSGENLNGAQQGESANDHQQHYQDALADLSLFARHSIVECSEAADTGHSAEIVGLPRVMIPSVYDWEFAINHIRLILSSITTNGGIIQPLLPNVCNIGINGQTMMLSCTQSIALYRACLHKSIDKVPEHVARWRDYLTSVGISSSTIMIDDVPTIVAFGGVSVLLPTASDGSPYEASVARYQKENFEEFIRKIRRARSNNDNDSVQLVPRRDPESDRSTKEDTVIEHSVVPSCQSSSEGNTNTFEVTCAGKQASSQPVAASFTPPCYSGPGCANANKENFIMTSRINQEVFDLFNQSMSLSQYYSSNHENSLTFLGEPYTLELMPATHIQGAAATVSVPQNAALSTNYEEFSRAYKTPYNFPSLPLGEPFPSTHNLEDNRFIHHPYPVTCQPLPAASNNHSNLVFSGSQQELDRLWSCFGQRLICLIRNCIPQHPGLRDIIERLLEDASFRRSLRQMLLEQYRPCIVPALPAVNVGATGATPVLFDGSDNDPEKWSKDYQRLEAFPLCNEPFLKLPDNSLDSRLSVFDHPHDITCEPLPASDVNHSKVLESGCKHKQETISVDPRSTLDQVLDSIRQLTPQCPDLCDVIEQLLVEDPDFHRSLIEMLSKEWHDKPCVVPTLPAVNMGVIGTLPVLFDGSDNDPEKWSKDYMMPEAFLPPLHLCGEFGLSHSLLEYNSVNSQDVTCKAEPTSDGSDEIQSSFKSEETTEYVSSTSSGSDESEKFIRKIHC